MTLQSKRLEAFSTQTNAFLRWGSRFFLFIGVLTLGYAGLSLFEARLYQAYEADRFQQALKSPSVDNTDHLYKGLIATSVPEVESVGTDGREGSPLGRISVSAIGLEVMILQGTAEETLRRGIGHIPGTALPGNGGNVALAGHRDTFFRPLRNIQQNDEITLTTLNGTHHYLVASTQVVEPNNVGVLDDSDESILTLVTCYPFDFVGSAPQRFIVRARRSSR